MSKLLDEALLDAKAVKETALANARMALTETFEPTLRRMVSSKLESEEEDDDFDIDINFDEPSEEEPTIDDDPAEEPIGMGSFEDDSTEELPADEEEEDAELESILRELDGDDELSLDDEELEEGEEESWVDPIDESDDEFEAELESLLREEEDEEEEVMEIKRENKQLKKKYNEALTAVTKLKSVINEVNLLNSKLMYNTKVHQTYALNDKQKIGILEAFDRCNSVREVKLVYSTVCNNLKRNQSTKKQIRVEGFASKSTPTIKPKQTNESFAFVSRWKQLAGLKPLED